MPSPTHRREHGRPERDQSGRPMSRVPAGLPTWVRGALLAPGKTASTPSSPSGPPADLPALPGRSGARGRKLATPPPIAHRSIICPRSAESPAVTTRESGGFLPTPLERRAPEQQVNEPVPASDQTAELRYLTALQVADLLQIDEKTVLRWSLQDPSLPVLRRGRVVRFPRERLFAWLQRQEPRTARRSARYQSSPPTPSADG